MRKQNIFWRIISYNWQFNGVMAQAINVSVLSNQNKDGCDVSYRAKQPRKSFPTGSSRASRIF